MAMSASGQIAEMTTMIGGAQSRFAHRGHMKGRAAYRRTQRRGSVVNALRAFLESQAVPVRVTTSLVPTGCFSQNVVSIRVHSHSTGESTGTMIRLIAAVLIGSMTSVSAQQLQALMPSPGQSMCYSRFYDRAHLTNHPDQLITTMILEIKAKTPPRHREPNMLYRDFDFRIGLKMRGSNRLLVSGDNCDWSTDRTGVHCSIACDMGHFDRSIARQPGSLMLTLDRLTFEGGAVRTILPR